jgi:hypothetical protein
VTRAPKLMFVDSGLASYLQTPRASEQSGGLMENFVMGELALLGLRYLKQKLGSRMHAGYVLYYGADSLSFGAGLGCLPISTLWRWVAASH